MTFGPNVEVYRGLHSGDLRARSDIESVRDFAVAPYDSAMIKTEILLAKACIDIRSGDLVGPILFR